jgi:hypothetical protein
MLSRSSNATSLTGTTLSVQFFDIAFDAHRI